MSKSNLIKTFGVGVVVFLLCSCKHEFDVDCEHPTDNCGLELVRDLHYSTHSENNSFNDCVFCEQEKLELSEPMP